VPPNTSHLSAKSLEASRVSAADCFALRRRSRQGMIIPCRRYSGLCSGSALSEVLCLADLQIPDYLFEVELRIGAEDLGGSTHAHLLDRRERVQRVCGWAREEMGQRCNS
jgi:hypothetical protein